jgi:site-specific DNA recombinase
MTLKVETNQPLTFTVSERAVLYARVSGDDTQNATSSIEGQLEMAREYADKRGYPVVAELYEDPRRKTSGYEIDLPVLGQIREMAEARQFDVLVVRELDRLSRSLAKQLIVEEELKRAGVRVEYCLEEFADSPEGRLNKHIKATIAEYEREKTRERLERGKQKAVKKGSTIVNGRPPYGYRAERSNTGKFSLVIEEGEARIVRMIYEWYVHDGLSIYAIVIRLSELHVPTPYESGGRLKGRTKKRGYGEWGYSTIGRIISSETYKGVWRYGKRNNSSKKWKDNPIDHQIVVDVPAIIPREMWEQAQAIKEANKAKAKRNRQHDYLMASRVTCGHCLRKMSGRSAKNGAYNLYLYYRCTQRLNPLACGECDLPIIRADYTDEVVREFLEDILRSPEKLVEAMLNYKREREAALAPLRGRLEIIDNFISQYNTDLKDALDSLADLKKRRADRARVAVLDEVERIEKTLDDLENQRRGVIAKLQEEWQDTRVPTGAIMKVVELEDGGLETVHIDKSWGTSHQQDLEDLKTFEGRRRLVEKYDIQVVLSLVDGQKMVHITGKLGVADLPIVGSDHQHT